MNSIRSALFLVLASLVLVPASPAQQYLPRFEKLVLPNGLQVVLHRDTAIPIVSIHISYHAGSARDPRGKYGLANLAGSLSLGGTKAIPAGQYTRIQSEPNVMTACVTNVDWTTLYATYPAHLLETALWLEADRMRSAGEQVTQRQFDETLRGILGQKRAAARAPLGDLQESIYREIYPGEYPYAHVSTGDTADLKKLRLADVKRFMRLFFVPANASITIGGHFEPERAREWVARYFGGIPAGATVAWDPARLVLPPLGGVSVIRQENVVLSQLHIIFPTVPITHPDEPLLALAAAFLGGSDVARLANLPAVNPSVVSVTATHSAQELDGALMIVVSCRPETRLGDVFRQVMTTLEELARTPPPDEELLAARNNAEMSLLTPCEPVAGLGGRTDFLNLSNLYADDPAFLFRQGYRQLETTPQDLQRVIRQYLLAGNRCVLSIVPPGKTHLAADAK
jgi:zinc protease